MQRISPCLKWTFVFFNVLFAIFGVLLFSFGLFAHLYLEPTEQILDGVHFFYTCGSVTFLLSCLGVYGAMKEKRYTLITFAVFMFLALLGLLLLAVPKTVAFPEEMSNMRNELTSVLPLNTASGYIQLAMKTIQSQIGCCGLFRGYEDWGGDIPTSCDCSPEFDNPNQCQQVTTRQTYFLINEAVRTIYSQKCGPVMMAIFKKVWTIGLAVVYGFAGLAFFGALLSLTMAFQIKSPVKKQQHIFSFSDMPPKYSELVNVS